MSETQNIPEGWKVVIAPTDLRIVSYTGDYVVRLQAGEEKAIHPSVYQPALVAGCSIPGGRPGQATPSQDIVADLLIAMADIVESGDEAKMTKEDGPRFSALKNIVPEFTDEQREEAWQAYLDQSTTEPSNENE